MGRRGVHVLLFLIPHGRAWATPAPASSPGPSAYDADALHCLNGLPSERTIGGAESLDGGSFGTRGDKGFYAVVLTLFFIRLLTFALVVSFPTQTSII